jgi:hypothetical protein
MVVTDESKLAPRIYVWMRGEPPQRYNEQLVISATPLIRSGW